MWPKGLQTKATTLRLPCSETCRKSITRIWHEICLFLIHLHRQPPSLIHSRLRSRRKNQQPGHITPSRTGQEIMVAVISPLTPPGLILHMSTTGKGTVIQSGCRLWPSAVLAAVLAHILTLVTFWRETFHSPHVFIPPLKIYCLDLLRFFNCSPWW